TNGVQKPDLYNLINRQGEVLSLCNDMTASIARFVCSNPSLDNNVKRYCYVADTFRYPRLYQGKNHQFLQAGVELIGIDGINSDIECIYLAYKSLKNCNVNNFTIHIGSSEFLNDLFDDFKINEELKNCIYYCIENKDYVSLKEMLNKNLDSDKTKFIIDLMLRGGHLSYMEKLMDTLKDYKSYNTLNYLKDVYVGLNKLGLDNIIFDFSIYSYAKYYTGIIFSIYVDDAKKSVISGGRTNDLFSSYGKEYPEIGFGLDVDTLTDYVLANNLIDVSCSKYVSISDDISFLLACENNNAIRNENIIVNHLYEISLDDAMTYAKSNGYEKLIEYKSNEIKIWEV
ncbi:MAG: ATP phosphoribosyltransferase regulatory subunit, partial [Acholeplasmatales bacterium]|nr:ATP phosphoribosyltransferase regulatory subunit [Acholeplasmatales bacterium]